MGTGRERRREIREVRSDHRLSRAVSERPGSPNMPGLATLNSRYEKQKKEM